MKKTLFAAGLAAAAIAFVPASVSADSYSGNWSEPAASTQEAGTDMSWNSDRCDRIDRRLDHLNTMFNQDNSNRVARQQRVIDRQNSTECAPTGTIVDELVSNGNFSTLVAAVQAAGLADTLSAPGQLTVFAPTDQAFANLPAGTVESLLADVPTLTKVLTNHVVAGAVNADTAVEVGEAPALSGNTLHIGYGDDGMLYVNDSRILLTDIMTTNGVIHVIDAVLVP